MENWLRSSFPALREDSSSTSFLPNPNVEADLWLEDFRNKGNEIFLETFCIFGTSQRTTTGGAVMGPLKIIGKLGLN